MENTINIKHHQVNHICTTIDIFKNYYLNHNYNENMFNSDGTLNRNYNNFKKTGIIAKIFEENWDKLPYEEKQLILKHRPNAEFEIKKIINCYNKNLGCSVFECPKCHDFVFFGHTCKSRFCTSCGYKYKLERVENILNTAYNCKHRQIVFTFAKELWPYFFHLFEEMINLLFEAVNLTIYSILNDTYKSKKGKKRKNINQEQNIHLDFLLFYILLVEI